MLRNEDDAIGLLLAESKDMRFVAKIKKIILTFTLRRGARKLARSD